MSRSYFIITILICIFVSLENGLEREPDNTEVEPQTPMLDIPDVALYTTFHLPQLTGLTTKTCYLRPACDAGLDEVTHHVLVYQLVVLLCMCQHVWSGTHDAHITDKHVPELWQFVNVGLTHEITERELARIVLRGLQAVGIVIYVHGAELIAPERAPVKPRAPLAEEDGARALTLDDDGNEWQQQDCGCQENGRQQDVGQTLKQSVQRVLQRTGVGAHHFQVVHLHRLHVEFFFCRSHIVEFYHPVPAQTCCPLYELALPSWHTQIDLIAQAQVLGVTQQREKFGGGGITATQLIAVGWDAENTLVQSLQLLVGPDESDCTRVEALSAQLFQHLALNETQQHDDCPKSQSQEEQLPSYAIQEPDGTQQQV